MDSFNRDSRGRAIFFMYRWRPIAVNNKTSFTAAIYLASIDDMIWDMCVSTWKPIECGDKI